MGALIAIRETLPSPIQSMGEGAQLRFIEFFTANIRNPNTRKACAQAAGDFLSWCSERGFYLTAKHPAGPSGLLGRRTRAHPFHCQRETAPRRDPVSV